MHKRKTAALIGAAAIVADLFVGLNGAATANAAQAHGERAALAKSRHLQHSRKRLARKRHSRQRSNKLLAAHHVRRQGWSKRQFRCLDRLWTRESNWNHRAANPSSGAYGIPQALPGRKMRRAGSDWRSNPDTQIRWGLHYIKQRYGTPCRAWRHSRATGSY